MTEQYEMVREFMRAFGQDVPREVKMPDVKTHELRRDLIREEMVELYNAETPEAYFDAVLDLLYVVLGAGVAAGFTPEQIAKGFAEVHRSNMSKMWTFDEVNANESDDFRARQSGTQGSERVWLATRLDGKIIKSPSYSQANLGPILEAGR